jgi:hypothetical protein
VSLKSFSLVIGGTIGLATGMLSRHVLTLTHLQNALSPLSLGFLGAAWGLSLVFLLHRLMERAREGTIRVKEGGETREFPLRRRHEVVARACKYLGGLSLGFLISLGVGWYMLAAAIPRMQSFSMTWSPDLQALMLTSVAAGSCLLLGEWFFRLTRKEGRTDHGPFVLVPSVLALGASLAGAL